MVWAGFRGTGRAVYRKVAAAIMMGAGTRARGDGCSRGSEGDEGGAKVFLSGYAPVMRRAA